MTQKQSGFNLDRVRYYDPYSQKFLSEDPIGFFSGDLNTYRYVLSNSMRFKDPSGKILQFGCDLAKKEFEDDITRIQSTEEGRRLIEMLQSSPTVFTIHLSFLRELKRSGNDIFIDANVNPIVLTNRGPKEASTTRILAHELGHLTGIRDKGLREMDNTRAWENPIMGELEGYLRTSYGVFQ